MKNKTLPAIERLISIYGSANKTSKALNCTRQLVDLWRKEGVIPYRRGAQIEELTNGKIKAYEIWQEASKRKNHD